MDDRRLSHPTEHRIRLTDGLAPNHQMTIDGQPTATHPWGDEASPYIQLGGDHAVNALANSFYDVVEESSPTLQAMLPKNTVNTRRKFYMYLSGWLGGPPLYEMKWGHPQLRRRHMPFPIGAEEAAEWMRCMREAIAREEIGDPLASFLDSRLSPLADHMINK